jgi:hypothetical protein
MFLRFIHIIVTFVMLRFFKRAPHVRKVLKKQGLKLRKKEYVELCYTGCLTINSKMIMPDDRLADGVYIIAAYAGNESIRFWVEVYRRNVRAYVM